MTVMVLSGHTNTSAVRSGETNPVLVNAVGDTTNVSLRHREFLLAPCP